MEIDWPMFFGSALVVFVMVFVVTVLLRAVVLWFFKLDGIAEDLREIANEVRERRGRQPK